MMQYPLVGIDQLESAQSGVSQMLNPPSTGSAMDEDSDIDWLHANPTYQRQTMPIQDVSHMSVTEGMHGQESYLPNLGMQMSHCSFISSNYYCISFLV